MQPSFFIFSLPRSGSSWLSVFLTGRDSFCYHEPTADYTPQEWMERASERPESTIGAVDTGAYIHASLITQALPEWTRYFVLERDPAEIERSTLTFNVRGYDAALQYEKLMDLPFPRISYENLGDLTYLRSVWEMAIGPGFDEARTAKLQEMNIQRDIGKFFALRPNLGEHMQKMFA